MRGDFLNQRRIPHSLHEPQPGKWKVVLHPHSGDDIDCGVSDSMVDAYDAAELEVRNRFPGKVL